MLFHPESHFFLRGSQTKTFWLNKTLNMCSISCICALLRNIVFGVAQKKESHRVCDWVNDDRRVIFGWINPLTIAWRSFLHLAGSLERLTSILWFSWQRAWALHPSPLILLQESKSTSADSATSAYFTAELFARWGPAICLRCRALERAACRPLPGPEPKPSFTWKSKLWQDPNGSGRNTRGESGCYPLRVLIPICRGPSLHPTSSEERAPRRPDTRRHACPMALPWARVWASITVN